MRQQCIPTVEIKAAGGIRSLDDMIAAIEAGASRIGTSATVAILEESKGMKNSSNEQKGDY
jgi:deoxyribose-phosphate aldolase